MKHIDEMEKLLDYMQTHVLETIQTSLTLLNDDKLEYKPGEGLNSLKFLMYHVVNSPYIYLSGIGKKEFTEQEFNSIAVDLKNIKKFKDLEKYYETFFSFINKLKTNLKPTSLTNTVSYNLDKVGWGSWSLTGQRALETAFEEMVHHRGQIYIYLRLLGIKPPIIYPYL